VLEKNDELRAENEAAEFCRLSGSKKINGDEREAVGFVLKVNLIFQWKLSFGAI